MTSPTEDALYTVAEEATKTLELVRKARRTGDDGNPAGWVIGNKEHGLTQLLPKIDASIAAFRERAAQMKGGE